MYIPYKQNGEIILKTIEAETDSVEIEMEISKIFGFTSFFTSSNLTLGDGQQCQIFFDGWRNDKWCPITSSLGVGTSSILQKDKITLIDVTDLSFEKKIRVRLSAVQESEVTLKIGCVTYL
jgi:hypothetical protein